MLVTAYETLAEPAGIYILDVRTGQRDEVVQRRPGRFFDARWLPDGNHVLVLSGGATQGYGAPGWWLLGIDDKIPQFVFAADDAAWSPDEKTIAALIPDKADGQAGAMDLELVSAASKQGVIITTLHEAESSSGLSWSHDGRYVTFAAGHYGEYSLYVLDTQTREVVQITDSIGAQHPAWSPTANVIAFEHYPGLNLITMDGKCRKEIISDQRGWSPSWSPDGSKIAYIGTDGIYILDVRQALGGDPGARLCH